MAARVLDGKRVAQQVLGSLAPRIARLKTVGIVPGLRVVRVGDDAASKIYVGSKLRACAQAGIDSAVVELAASTDAANLNRHIVELNADRSVHGILVQLPLPPALDPHLAAALVAPEKDVDGFHPSNLGRLLQGQIGLAACTPSGIMRLLDAYAVELSGKNAVVVGRTEIVGKPMALMLLARDATVTVCHSRTRNLAEHTRNADVLVVAAGRPGLIDASMVKSGAAVIDVGINRNERGQLVGDVDAASVQRSAGYLTPVPGGVGPMTVAMLVENTVFAAEMSCASRLAGASAAS